jgi:hypothetical protein
MEQPGIMEQIRRLGAQRRAREVFLAVLLTIAALGFLATAIFGREASLEASAEHTNPYETAHKPELR